jgi:hypothetical protein
MDVLDIRWIYILDIFLRMDVLDIRMDVLDIYDVNNEDGYPDMVVGRNPDDEFNAELYPNIWIRLGDTNGHFSKVNCFSVGSRLHTVQLADLNGDGLLDMLTYCSGSKNLTIFLGSGDGSFQPQQKRHRMFNLYKYL